MNTKRIIVGAALAAAAIAPAAADARIVEMGLLEEPATPSCPEDCAAVPRTSGFQKQITAERDTFTVPADGRIVAWTITLGAPTKSQIRFFEEESGYGEASAGITAFRASTVKGERGLYTSIGESGQQELSGYFGRTVQFPMANTMKVRKGDRIGLTVPTWAPALAVDLERNNVWRATRPEDGCDDLVSQTAISNVGTKTAFGCAYRGAQLTFSVTLVTKPKPTKPKKNER